MLTGGRLLQESAYSFSRFARGVLGTNNIDCRARAISEEETQFLSSVVAGRGLAESVTYADLQRAGTVVLVSFEPEDESPIVFLRLRKAVRKHNISVVTVAPLLSAGSRKLRATLAPAAQGDEAAALAALEGDLDGSSIVLVGERAATSPGTLSAVARPGRAHRRPDRLDPAACRRGRRDRRRMPSDACCPAGVPSTSPRPRRRVDHVGRRRVAHRARPRHRCDAACAASDGSLKALVVAGVQPGDLADPAAALAALEHVGFLVSFEQRLSDVAQRADVVFPVPLVEEQNGTFVDWEHRPRRVKVRQPGQHAPR